MEIAFAELKVIHHAALHTENAWDALDTIVQSATTAIYAIATDEPRAALAGEAATAAKTPKSGLVHEHATAQPERPSWSWHKCLIIAVSLSIAVVSALWIVGAV